MAEFCYQLFELACVGRGWFGGEQFLVVVVEFLVFEEKCGNAFDYAETEFAHLPCRAFDET